MPFLYGDSTPSTLEINYIDFLRDALDFSAQVLGADERQGVNVARAGELRRAAEIEVARLESFGDAIARAVEVAGGGAPDSPTTQCALGVKRSAADLVRNAIDRVRAAAEGEIAQRAAQAERDRGAAAQALGTLVLRHDLPDATTEVRVALADASRYVARLHVHALGDLNAVIDLDIAADNPFAHALRVDKVVERLEVHAPEISGWLRKEVKLKPQRLDKEYITELVVSGNDTRISLRASLDGAGAGYDVVVRRQSPRVSLTRVGEGAELPAFDLTDDDETKMLDLEEKLVGAAGELIDARRALAEATLGGQPLVGHPAARTMVERLVEKMAPIVQEIARRSQTQTELVLKRLLDNGRREEIFISRDELERKFDGLSGEARAILASLGLSEPARIVAVSASLSPAPASVAPPPVVVAPPPTESQPPPAPASAAHAEETVVARPVPSERPPASVPVTAAPAPAPESQRPSRVSPPRPSSIVPPRPSRTPPPAAAPTPPDDDWSDGKP
jgi:hypothetical protein